MFVHLRTHTAYSLAEGAIKTERLVDLCLENNMPAVGITDTNNLFGALEIALLCKKKGIQAIMGSQINLNCGDFSAPLVLLAKNKKGYLNLLSLVSKIYINDKESSDLSIDLTELESKGEGLICLTGGAKGPIGKLIQSEKKNDAETLLKKLQAIFQDNLYIEIQRHGLKEEKVTEPYFLKYAIDFKLGIVATNNAFFENQDMFEAHDALLCIAGGNYVVEEDRRKETQDHYFKTSSEMELLFKDLPEAIKNTVNIAKRVHFMPDGHSPILPKYPTKDDRSEFEELKSISYIGLNKRLEEEVYTRDNSGEKNGIKAKYFERLDYELNIIKNMGFPGYFLIVADFIQWAKKQGIPVGPGRGSGAGSLVAWAMTITDMDPIYFGLIFERFLNPERVSMPDFDVDFCQDRRDEVISYVTKRYGYDCVAHIITFGKLQARAVLRDVGRVLQIPYGQVGKLCELVPNNPANPVTLEEAIRTEPLLKQNIEEDETVSKLFSIGRQLEGLYRHASTHAAGIVIGDRPISEVVPLYKDEKSALAVTQFNMKMVEKAGLVKFDFLGLKTLTVIECASEIIREHHNSNFIIQKIPLDDKKTFELLRRVETVGIFQLESSGMKDVIRRLKPDRFEDLIALVALYRPGPMDDIPRYVACKHGEEEVTYLHPMLEEILAPTYGVMVYQEQVMHIAQKLAGYTLGAADLLRRAMGKKIKQEMDAQRDLFVTGAVKNDIKENIAHQIFDQMAKFAGYGFNKSHSAPYALLAYQTAYLKANYPLEFYAASMTYDIHNTEKLNVFRQDLKELGYTILPPDINESYATFKVDQAEKAVRYALGAIKNVGIQAIESVTQERTAKGRFKSLLDFIKRVNTKALNKRMLENLVLAGAMDNLHGNRKQLVESMDVILKKAQLYDEEEKSKQARLFGASEKKQEDYSFLASIDDFLPLEKLQNEFFSLGYYLSAHPLDVYRSLLPTMGVMPFSDILERNITSDQNCVLAGVLLNKQERTSKVGNKFAFLRFSDNSGVFETALFSDKYVAYRETLEEGCAFLIESTIRKKDDQDELKIHINTLKPLDSIKSQSVFFINLNTQKNLERIIDTLNKQKAGEMRVLFNIRENNYPTIKIELKKRLNISPEVQTLILSLANI